MIERLFRVQERGSTVRTEVLAGITTFLAMAYILPVNSGILSETGMPFNAALLATAYSAFFATMVMALWANYPFALAPGMGLNAYFAYSVVLGMGVSWQTALGAVFISGALFLVLTYTKAREAVIDAVPMPLKYAIGAGIGLFIAFIGLTNGGLVVADPATFVTLGDFSSRPTLLTAIGVLITTSLVVMRMRGAILIGIVATALIGIPMGVTGTPSGVVALPQFGEWGTIFGKLDIAGALSLGLGTVIFAFFFVDLFDSAGTMIGLSDKAGYLDKQGRLPGMRRAMAADSVGTMAGAVAGTPTVTSYIESSAGISEGGRTGLTAAVVAILFFVAPFFAPIISVIPPSATAPALIIVGALMMSAVGKIDWDNLRHAVPAFIGLIAMPLTFSIANGIFLAFIAYSFISLITGKLKESSPLVHLLSLVFVLKFIFL